MEAEGTETGSRFGRFVVVHDQGGKTRRRVTVECDCGVVKAVILSNLRKGLSRSCGCLQAEVRPTINFRHGGYRDQMYKVWQQMRFRCQNSEHHAYPSYGGRGISVAPEWEDYATFIRDMGPRPSEAHTIDRINNNEGYKPGNVRWATRVEQARNRRSTHFLTLNGETLCIKEWAEKLGVSYAALRARIGYGFSTEEALTRPFRKLARRSA